MKLLVIDDEPKALAYLERGLSEAGYAVDAVSNGESALTATRTCEYALIVCDVMMPRRDGFSFVTAFRKSGGSAPVLLVTARDDIASRVRGLDLGADDYLAKPYALSELLARVRALIRRGPVQPVDIYRVADLTCDPRTRRVERAGKRIDLTPKEFLLLQFLLEHASEVVSRRLIAERVWSMNFDPGTNAIEVQMRRLREKIELHGTMRLIHTVRGVGYVLDERGEES